MTIMGINAIGTRHSGAASVLLSTLNVLLKEPDVNRVVVFASPESQRRFTFPEAEALTIRDAPPLTNNPIQRFVWLNTRFADHVKADGCHVVYNMNNYAGCLPVPQVLFIQQSLYFSNEALAHYMGPNVSLRPRLHLLAERFLVPRIFAASIGSSDLVVVQTETMKRQLQNRYNTNGTPVVVIPPAVAPMDEAHVGNMHAVSDSLKAFEERGIVHWAYIGNDAPYKNLGIIEHVSKIALRNGDRWRFHMVGGQTAPLWENEITHWHPYINSKALGRVYQVVDALIMPSFTETVGLPMVEAMIAGTPVVAADLAYAHEICGNCGIFFDPDSPDDLYRKLKTVQNVSPINLARCQSEAIAKFSDANCQQLSKLLVDLATGKNGK